MKKVLSAIALAIASGSPAFAQGLGDLDLGGLLTILTGPPGTLSGYEVVTEVTEENSEPNKSLFAICPAGKTALGGGARIFGFSDNSVLQSSGPDGDPTLPDRWFGDASEMYPGNDGDWGLRVDVFCATAPATR